MNNLKFQNRLGRSVLSLLEKRQRSIGFERLVFVKIVASGQEKVEYHRVNESHQSNRGR